MFKLQFYERTIMSDPSVFKRLFVSFKACVDGFLNGCRPFIGVDGCHLKGTYGGVLLAAVTVDGNKGLFPIAYCVVECECKESWNFFLCNLYIMLQSVNYVSPITFMSDKQKGLCDAISNTFRGCHHRWCSRHLYQNFKSLHPGVLLRKHFWRVAKASNQFYFDKAMNDMKATKKEAFDWLSRNTPNMWTRHFSCKSDHITNSMTESFNQWIGLYRGKPILTLIDEIKKKLMNKM
ncbi:uncharacterized protein LOC122067285 [Macadamia integrifolia]|uniref:uncharacterized protein LOC122067285 n=1 Tax=Macadamia integrifolia TaxID=60698 RepID=UPI001C4FB646|nr:uncharacterized protein LOC122067285 [Macadamia integrifolia]